MKRAALALGVLVALVVFVSVASRVGSRARFAAVLSSYGAGPDGAKGLFELTEALGERPARLTEDFGRLDPADLVVMLGRCDLSAARTMTNADRDAMRRFLERGGKLLVLGKNGLIDETFGVEFEEVAQCVPRSLEELMNEALDPSADSPAREAAYTTIVPDDKGAFVAPVLGGAGPIVLRNAQPIVVREGTRAETWLSDDQGRVHAVRVPIGEGEAIFVSSSSPFENRSLSWHRGAVIFARLLRELRPRGRVVFDEFHLGVGDRRSTIGYLVDLGAGPLLLAACLGLVAFLWRASARLLPSRGRPPEPPRGLAETMRGLGALYRRVGDAHATFGGLVRAALGRVARHHHLAQTGAEGLSAELKRAGLADEAEAVRAIEALRAEPANMRDWKRFESKLDALTEVAMNGKAKQ